MSDFINPLTGVVSSHFISHSQANALYEYFVTQAKAQGISVATGEFGADMQVSLCNDGPVTFNLSV